MVSGLSSPTTTHGTSTAATVTGSAMATTGAHPTRVRIFSTKTIFVQIRLTWVVWVIRSNFWRLLYLLGTYVRSKRINSFDYKTKTIFISIWINFLDPLLITVAAGAITVAVAINTALSFCCQCIHQHPQEKWAHKILEDFFVKMKLLSRSGQNVIKLFTVIIYDFF